MKLQQLIDHINGEQYEEIILTQEHIETLLKVLKHYTEILPVIVELATGESEEVKRSTKYECLNFFVNPSVFSDFKDLILKIEEIYKPKTM